ncbi:DNA primase [Metapseudomonas furukawaii]|nr:DNA primase [Pseudomonas furukawaii]
MEKTDEKGRPVLDDKGQPEKETVMLDRPRVFWATVFNAEQIDGIPERVVLEPTWNKHERAEAIIQASGAQVVHDQSDNAFYRVSTDKIHMPSKAQFPSADNYYATKFHELGHWTGHPSRLDRPVGQNPFGSEEYAKEELRAEIASMILGDELGLGHDPGQHVAYVKSWIKVLQDDPMEIFRAAADAERIQKFVLGFEQQQTQNQGQGQAESVAALVAEKSPLQQLTDLRARGVGLSEALEQSSIMSGPDSRLTEALQEVRGAAAFAGSVPGSAIELLREMSGEALGSSVLLPHDWNGVIQLKALVQDASGNIAWASDSPLEPQLFGVYVQHSDGTHQSLADFNRPADAVKFADRLLLIDAHAQTNVEDRDKRLAGLELARVDARLELAQSMALPGSNPVESWGNLQQHAASNGLKASIELGEGKALARNELPGTFLIRYTDQNDQHTGITTQLNEDGKAKTFVHGKGLHGKGYTAEPEWQQQALDEAIQMQKAERQRREAAMDPKEPATEKTYLSVPFKEKNEAKALGAKWDGKATSWYVPEGQDLALFSKWRQPPQQDKGSELEPGQPEQPVTSAPEKAARQYLAVPYGEREAAKALGARWDKTAGSWYAGEGADPEKLKRWSPEAVAEQQKMSPQEEFQQACRDAGLKMDGLPKMDGQRYRVALVNDKPGEKSGVYIGHLDGHPAGFIQNHKTGIKQNWKSKGYSLTDEERAKHNAEAAEKLQARERERQAKYEEKAATVSRNLRSLVPPTALTEYQQAKGIAIHQGILTDREGKRTYVPAQDIDGKVWTMQYIREDGSKRFPKDSRKEGCFHVVGGMDALAKAPVIAVGEGYATMSTASESLGFATVAAFDSGNLKNVAAALQQKFPGKPVLFVGDDDHASSLKPNSQGINAGRMKAEAAAKELGGHAVFPTFAPGELEKGLSDFNDMATKSVLGREGAERQLKGAVSHVLGQAREAARQLAQQRQQEKQQTAGMTR